jgi:hypothetical protein
MKPANDRFAAHHKENIVSSFSGRSKLVFLICLALPVTCLPRFRSFLATFSVCRTIFCHVVLIFQWAFYAVPSDALPLLWSGLLVPGP